jgi:hypothetical protein
MLLSLPSVILLSVILPGVDVLEFKADGRSLKTYKQRLDVLVYTRDDKSHIEWESAFCNS